MSLVRDLRRTLLTRSSVPPFVAAASDCIVAVHLILVTIQVIGSLWSRRLLATCNAQTRTT